MNPKNETGAVELLLLAGAALLWAAWQVVRLLVVPLLTLLVALVTPRRRPAPQPAASAPEPAPAAAEPGAAAVVPAAPQAPVAAAEPVLVATKVVPVAPCLADLAETLMALPGRQLMELAGTRRKLPKAQLAAMICAMV